MQNLSPNEMIPLSGNTFQIRGLLSSKGAVWDRDQKKWLIDKENFSEVQQLIHDETAKAKEERRQAELTTPIEVYEATAIKSLYWIHTHLVDGRGWYTTGEKKVERARLAIQKRKGDTLWINQAFAFLLEERMKHQIDDEDEIPSDKIVRRIAREKITADGTFLNRVEKAEETLNDFYAE